MFTYLQFASTILRLTVFIRCCLSKLFGSWPTEQFLFSLLRAHKWIPFELMQFIKYCSLFTPFPGTLFYLFIYLFHPSPVEGSRHQYLPGNVLSTNLHLVYDKIKANRHSQRLLAFPYCSNKHSWKLGIAGGSVSNCCYVVTMATAQAD